MSAPLLYSVILMQEYSLSDVAKVFALHRKILLPDAARFAKGRWGFLADSVSEDEARTMQHDAETCGLSAKAIPATRVMPPPELRPAALLSINADNFEVKTADGKQGCLVYDDVGVLAVYAWKNVTETTELIAKAPSRGATLLRAGVLVTTGIPLSKKKVMVEQTSEVSSMVFFMDVILKQPLIRLRIDGQAQSYGLLKERMVHGVNANFRVLAELFASKVRAQRNRGADLFLSGKPVGQMGYAGAKDAELEMSWLLTRLREARNSA